ncbi:MAG: hypothetical protein JWL60_917 [Gemmatimonadetes bacterium]|jgi:hypothetical protein|nr:hypothetical protein [Gemmatimonadota bacterium]
MTIPTLLRSSAALVLCAASLAACQSRGEHAVDGDTGAAAPATTIDMSATPKTPDSTMGVAPATGSAAPAGTTDTTKKVGSPSALPGPNPPGSSTPGRP